MNKETITEIGMWSLMILLVVLAAVFATKGNNDAAGAFGLGAGVILFVKYALD